LEPGGTYVLANIRGGGEFGPKWHEAARKENRQRAYDDFIAVAEDLIQRKVTSPQHLGIQGGSNGGLLMGVMLTERPDLFKAVVCQVPLLDMKRFNKLLAGASGYDLVFPTGYAVEVLIATGLAAPIEKRVLTNWGNLAPLFLDRSFDPGNRYTVPYQWGVTGYAYRTDRISPAPDSWDVLWDTRYAGKMTQLDDGREVLTPFLLMRGYSLNSVNPSQLEEAKIDAIRAKKNIKAYIAAPVKGQLISGDVWLAQLWNGDATQAKLEQPAIGYVIPKEGCSIWVDSLVIPRHASHKRAAHEFMNYILRADVGAAISDTTGYGSPNAAAVARMEHPVPFPTDEEMKRLEFQKDLGKATALVDQIYTEIKAE